MSDPHTWPADPRLAALQTSIDAIRRLCTAATTGLTSLANDSISARAVLRLLPEEDS